MLAATTPKEKTIASNQYANILQSTESLVSKINNHRQDSEIDKKSSHDNIKQSFLNEFANMQPAIDAINSVFDKKDIMNNELVTLVGGGVK